MRLFSLKRETDYSDWKRWFAWRPVVAKEWHGDKVSIVWLETVTRRGQAYSDGDAWEYMRLEPEAHKPRLARHYGVPQKPPTFPNRPLYPDGPPRHVTREEADSMLLDNLGHAAVMDRALRAEPPALRLTNPSSGFRSVPRLFREPIQPGG